MKATDNEYCQQQQALLPVGHAWSREPEGIVSRILAGLALVWARVHGRALALVEEADPTTARETLVDWEENLGLPDECTVNTATTLQERRAAVAEKYVSKGNQSVSRFYEVAEDLGYQVTVKEYRPFVTGISRCGDALNGGHEVRFVFTVTPHGPRLTRFRCGESTTGEKLLKITRAADLECRLRKSAYAHVLPILNYEETIR